jgi:hypothetical protein
VRVAIDVVPTASLGAPAWDDVWRLTRALYDTDRDFVEQTLRAHQRMVLFRSREEGALVGMAAVDVVPVDYRGRKLVALYTSHVLIDERHRGQNLIQRVGFRTFLETRLRFPLRPTYWFFETFSYKSYLLLPRNFRDYWPRFDRETPAWERGLMHELASRFHGPAWRPEQGFVSRSGRKRLRPDTAPLRPTDDGNPHLEFFARTTPGHAEGDMLVCLCPLSARNWLTIGIRLLNRSRRTSR